MTKFQLIPSIDQSPKLIAFCQNNYGKFLLYIAFASVLSLNLLWANKYFQLTHFYFWDKLIILGLIYYFPKYKTQIFTLSSMYWFFVFYYPQHIATSFIFLAPKANSPYLFYYSLIIFLILLYSINFLIKKLNHKVSIALIIYTLLVFITTLYPTGSYYKNLLLGSLLIMSLVLWHWLYSLKYNFSLDNVLRCSFSFWNWSVLPIPKSYNHLNASQVNLNQTTTLHLRALKLLLWASFLGGLEYVLSTFTNYLHIPRLETLILNSSLSSSSTIGTNWLSVITEFLLNLLSLTVGSHIAVAVIRFCGWDIKRNVYSPFKANSISDFFNRYYFYFKELLLDIFFYPAYFAFFKRNNALRLFTATLLSAGLGNFLFHFFLSFPRIITQDLAGALQKSSIYAFYCLLLSFVLFISQNARLSSVIKKRSLLSSIFIKSRIIFVFLMLNIFLESSGTTTLKQHLSFTLALFGIS